MKNTISIPKVFLIVSVPISILGFLVYIIQSSSYLMSDQLNMAISLDLLVTLPFVYFLLIRNSKISKTTIVPILIIGLLVGYNVLPKEQHYYLDLFKVWTLPLIELAVLTMIFIKVRRAVLHYKTTKEDSPDFFDTLKSTCYSILPNRLAMPFATEVAVVYYGFIQWKTRPLKDNEYSYHKKSGTSALIIALIMLIGAEAFTMHVILAQYYTTAAWILTFLSVYTAFQFFGFAKSLSRRPIAISDHSLQLKFGIMNEVEIPFKNITRIEFSRKALSLDDKYSKKLSLFEDFESHNIVLEVDEVSEFNSLYGFKKKFKILAFHVDQPEDFMASINAKLNQCQA